MSTIYKPSGRAAEYAEWALNLYNGCVHGCTYCYVPLCRKVDRTSFHQGCAPYKDVLKKLRKDAADLRGTIHTPILLSFTSDVYQPGATITREAIQILKENKFAVCILTKGGLRATADFDVLEPKRDVVASSLTWLDPKQSLKWEPQGALPDERMQLLADAKRAGFRTWASLEPVVNHEQALELIRRTQDFTDLYKIGLINYHELKRQINWGAFVKDAHAVLMAKESAWYFKDSLVPYLNGIFRTKGGFI